MDDPGLKEALRRIEAAGLERAEVLEAGGLGLTEVPEAFYELGWLKVLYLGGSGRSGRSRIWPIVKKAKRNAMR